jgi:hypothetical protein
LRTALKVTLAPFPLRFNAGDAVFLGKRDRHAAARGAIEFVMTTPVTPILSWKVSAWNYGDSLPSSPGRAV